MDERAQKRPRAGREEWARRVERWRDSGLTTAQFAAELGINPKSLTYWAWTLKREAAGQKRVWPAKRRGTVPPTTATVPAKAAPAGFVEVSSRAGLQRFELEVRGRRLHIPSDFDVQQLRSLLEVLESA